MLFKYSEINIYITLEVKKNKPNCSNFTLSNNRQAIEFSLEYSQENLELFDNAICIKM